MSFFFIIILTKEIDFESMLIMTAFIMFTTLFVDQDTLLVSIGLSVKDVFKWINSTEKHVQCDHDSK